SRPTGPGADDSNPGDNRLCVDSGLASLATSRQLNKSSAARLGSLSADSSAGPVGRLGRWAGTTAVAEAPGSFETEQGCATSTVSREGHPLIIRDPIDPHRADRWDRGFVTKEALCRADPDLREPQGSNPLGPPGPELWPVTNPGRSPDLSSLPIGCPPPRSITDKRQSVQRFTQDRFPQMPPKARPSPLHMLTHGNESLRVSRLPPLRFFGCVCER